MPSNFSTHDWAVILGGSSGFGLATAHKLSRHGMNLLIVHRDRRGAMARITPEFEQMRARGVRVCTHNADALGTDSRTALIDALAKAKGESGRVRLLMHSIAFGNLKPIAHDPPRASACAGTAATAGAGPAGPCLDEEDLARTLHAMGTSLLGWTQALHLRGCFADDARVVGMTSEGNRIAWHGYAAVSAAKAALEAVSRALAVELGPHGIRSNIVQAGVTDTPALRCIPGHEALLQRAQARNPLGRLTRPQDVADVVYLLCQPEAAWINGSLVVADGGESVSGILR